METKNIHLSSPVTFIRERYLEKRKTNPHYSIAAFARNLDLSPSFLSRLLTGERPLTIKLAVQIATLFNLSAETTDDWISNIITNSSKHAKISKKLRERVTQKAALKTKHPIYYYELERFKAVSEWYHLAILNLTFVKGFNSSSTWISKRLGISRMEAEAAISRLIELGFMGRVGEKLKPTKNMLFVNQKKTDYSIRQFHQQMCDKARDALQDPKPEAFDHQFFSGISLAFDRKRMPEFKKKLLAFSQEIIQMSAGESYSDVYHLNLQLFPVTKEGNSL